MSDALLTHRYRTLIRCLRLRRIVARRQHVHLHALASTFRVSTRTIRRDLAALKAAGETVASGYERDIDSSAD
jgi:DeoR/GlpR family transcriptional regulator of sugar metabolism